MRMLLHPPRAFSSFFCDSQLPSRYPRIMQNEAGEIVDVYIPRKCSASGRIIGAKDHASIQLNIADVDDKTGRVTGSQKTYAICGFIRGMGESDDCINRLTAKDGISSGLTDQQQN